MAFDIIEFMLLLNNFDFSFQVYKFMELLQFNIHLHHLATTCLIISQYKVYFFLPVIFTIEAVVVLMVPYGEYLEFLNYLELVLLRRIPVFDQPMGFYHPNVWVFIPRAVECSRIDWGFDQHEVVFDHLIFLAHLH